MLDFSCSVAAFQIRSSLAINLLLNQLNFKRFSRLVVLSRGFRFLEPVDAVLQTLNLDVAGRSRNQLCDRIRIASLRKAIDTVALQDEVYLIVARCIFIAAVKLELRARQSN